MDINKEIQKATDKVLTEKLPEMVESKVSKMIESVMDDLFGNYSDAQKQIKKAVEESLNISLKKFNIVEFNAMVSGAVADNLNSQIDMTPIKEIVSGLVGNNAKDKIALSDIVEDVLAIASEENEDDYSGGITFIAKPNRNGHELYVDLDPDVAEHNCALKITIHKTADGVKSKILGIRTGGANMDVETFAGFDYNKLAAYFFKLYNNQVFIDIDETEFDTTWEKY